MEITPWDLIFISRRTMKEIEKLKSHYQIKAIKFTYANGASPLSLRDEFHYTSPVLESEKFYLFIHICLPTILSI